ncbi:MAG: hypothetical protein U0132_10810 [Gemmatimonadaceae bacterium]
MSLILRLKVALFIIGGVLLAYGIKQDQEALRFAAIGALGLAFVLRFFERRSKNDEPPADD